MRSHRLTSAFAVVLLSLLAVACSGTSASSVQWQGSVGIDSAHPDCIYVLLGAGFMRATTSADLETIVAEWIEEHPKAEIVLAADYRSMSTDGAVPGFCWAWVVDGEACLNVELVRRGACGANTMGIPGIPDVDATVLIVTDDQYRDFRDRVTEAEVLAREERLGVWADSPRAETDSEDSWSIAEPWDDPTPDVPILFPVRNGDKWGYIDKTGHMVVDFLYDDAGRFHEGLGAVKVGDVWGYVDEHGHMVIAPEYESAWGFSNGLARVWSPTEKGYIDRVGALVIPADSEWSWFSSFSEGLAPVGFDYTMSSDVGYVDTSGKLVIQIAGADSARGFSDGLAAVRRGGYGYIDRSGQFVIEPQFYDAEGFCDGLAVVKSDSYFDEEKGEIVDKFEIIDSRGELVAELPFNQVNALSEDRAAVQDYQGKWPDGVWWWGYVDGSGELAIPLEFKSAGMFRGGLASVEDEDGKMGYVDLDGNYVWQEE